MWLHCPKLCTYQCKAGGGGRAWGGHFIVFVGPWVGHLTDLVLPGEGIFESFYARRGTDVSIFDCRFGRKRLRPNIHALRTLRTVWNWSGNHGSQREQAKGEWISLYWSIEPFQTDCGIKVNGGKEKPSRFLQVNWSLYGWHLLQSLYKAYKTDFLCTLYWERYIQIYKNVNFLLKVSNLYSTQCMY